MYQLSINNSGEDIKQGEFLSFSIAGFPANTDLDFYISERNKSHSLEGNITSDANGGGVFRTQCGVKPGNYTLSVRNYTYGTVRVDFTVS